jgi:soluble lytic murein transglycosylase-like protein
MSYLARLAIAARAIRQSAAGSLGVFLRDTGQGLLEVSHNSLALLGLLLVAAALFLNSRQDVRGDLEVRTLAWLQARQEARIPPAAPVVEPELVEPEAVVRATATDPKELTRQQAAVALWLARRYRVAPEPISRLVQEAWHVGARTGLEPTLILAIMAVESSFNPFAQSSVGAQGLMQVMTKIHDAKYEAFGGVRAAFDPVTNVRVGVQVLKECIARAGSLEAGLRYYVGAGNGLDDGGYAAKVLAEQNHLQMVASGRSVPVTTGLPAPRPAPAPVAVEAAPAPTPAAPASDKPADPPTPERIALWH